MTISIAEIGSWPFALGSSLNILTEDASNVLLTESLAAGIGVGCTLLVAVRDYRSIISCHMLAPRNMKWEGQLAAATVSSMP